MDQILESIVDPMLDRGKFSSWKEIGMTGMAVEIQVTGWNKDRGLKYHCNDNKFPDLSVIESALRLF